MFDKVLHANDGSKSAIRALSLALAITREHQSELHMVCVEEVPLSAEIYGRSSRFDGRNRASY
jgi:nucleotide-binding universal stress UspA family protein